MIKLLNNLIKLLRDIVFAPIKFTVALCVTFLIVIKKQPPEKWITFMHDTLEEEEDDEPVNISLSS